MHLGLTLVKVTHSFLNNRLLGAQLTELQMNISIQFCTTSAAIHEHIHKLFKRGEFERVEKRERSRNYYIKKMFVELRAD
jgi:hypothetical protein